MPHRSSEPLRLLLALLVLAVGCKPEPTPADDDDSVAAYDDDSSLVADDDSALGDDDSAGGDDDDDTCSNDVVPVADATVAWSSTSDWVQVLSALGEVCGLHSNGDVQCWGHSVFADMVVGGPDCFSCDPPAGPFASLGQVHDLFCGLRPPVLPEVGGLLECWSIWPEPTEVFEGPYGRFLRMGGLLTVEGCLAFPLSSDGLEYPGLASSYPGLEDSLGRPLRDAMFNRAACVVHEDGELICYCQPQDQGGDQCGSHGRGFNSVVDGSPDSSRTVCGVRESGRRVCFGGDFAPDVRSPPPPQPDSCFVWAGGGADSTGLRTDGLVEVWNCEGWESHYPGSCSAPPDVFAQVHGQCGVTADGRLGCWGFPLNQAGPPP